MDQRTKNNSPATSGPGMGAASTALAGGLRLNSSTSAPSAQASQNPNETRNRARTALQNLLAGSAPDGIDAATLGGWSEDYHALVDAHAAGGTQAVRTVFNTLTRTNPALGFLVGTDPEPAKLWYSQADVYAMELPELVWIVPDLIHAGLTILSGQGKIGKSWLALQIAHAVATGGHLLGRHVERRRVAYIAYEDGFRRIKARGLKQGIPQDAGIFYADTDQVPMLNTPEGVEFVLGALGEYDLVILDTLGRALDVKDRNNYAEMTGAMGPIQRAAQAMNKAVLCLDHHGKLTTLTRQGTPNPILDILGSVGLAGVVDCAIGLYKQHGETDLILSTTGKEAEPVSLVLHWDALTVCWQLVGAAEDVARNKSEEEILDAITAMSQEQQLPTTKALASYLGKLEPAISRTLGELVTSGKVVKCDRVGKQVPYLLPGMELASLL